MKRIYPKTDGIRRSNNRLAIYATVGLVVGIIIVSLSIKILMGWIIIAWSSLALFGAYSRTAHFHNTMAYAVKRNVILVYHGKLYLKINGVKKRYEISKLKRIEHDHPILYVYCLGFRFDDKYRVSIFNKDDVSEIVKDINKESKNA